MEMVVLKRRVVTGRFMKAVSLSCDAQNKMRTLTSNQSTWTIIASKLNYFETEQNPVS